jgi:flagellar hook-associated protein 2
MTARLSTVEARLRAQYSALDTMMSKMQSTSSFLTQQLASLPTISRS